MKCGLVSVIGPLCCLEIKMGVAEQLAVYKSFSTVLVRVQFLRMPYNHILGSVVRTKLQCCQTSQQQRLYIYLHLTCREGGK